MSPSNPRMRLISIVCNKCGAQVGEWCKHSSSRKPPICDSDDVVLDFPNLFLSEIDREFVELETQKEVIKAQKKLIDERFESE